MALLSFPVSEHSLGQTHRRVSRWQLGHLRASQRLCTAEWLKKFPLRSSSFRLPVTRRVEKRTCQQTSVMGTQLNLREGGRDRREVTCVCGCLKVTAEGGGCPSECQATGGSAVPRPDQPPCLPLRPNHPGLRAPSLCGLSVYSPCPTLQKCSFCVSASSSAWEFLEGRRSYFPSFIFVNRDNFIFVIFSFF